MKCGDRQCVQCYPAEAAGERKFWRVVVFVVIVLLVAAVIALSGWQGSDKSYGSNGSNILTEKSK